MYRDGYPSPILSVDTRLLLLAYFASTEEDKKEYEQKYKEEASWDKQGK